MNVRGQWALAVGLGLGLGALAVSSSGCARPVVAKDGTMVFQQEGTKGAGVLTANGIEYHDGTDLPTPVIVRDANQPFRAPVGFILPANGFGDFGRAIRQKFMIEISGWPLPIKEARASN